MKQERHVLDELGDTPPLVADKRRRPDRRQVSARWLAGTLLTGVTSVLEYSLVEDSVVDSGVVVDVEVEDDVGVDVVEGGSLVVG